ncbi:hypothetical protein TVAGG3_0856100, partial [Trichomonas vaginalis G3]
MRMLQTLFPFCTYICRVYHWHSAPICAEWENLALLPFDANVANTFPILHIYMQGLSLALCTNMCRMGKSCTFTFRCECCKHFSHSAHIYAGSITGTLHQYVQNGKILHFCLSMRMLQTLFPFCTYICRVYHWHPAPICAEWENLALLPFDANVANTFPILHIYMQGLSLALCTNMCRMGKSCTFAFRCECCKHFSHSAHIYAGSITGTLHQYVQNGKILHFFQRMLNIEFQFEKGVYKCR